MPTLNGDAAVAWMRAKVTNIPGSCLNTCWQAYGSHSSTGPHAGQYPNAINGWQYATRRHPGDYNPPAGFPVYFDALTRPRYAGDTNYAAGDVGISVGGGNVICTDGAGAGRIAVMSIRQRAAQIGRVYLGWTEDFLGYDVITSATSTAGFGATPLEGDMPLDDTDKAFITTTIQNLLNSVGQAIIEQITGNGAYANGDLTINQLRRDLGYLHTGAEDGLAAIYAKAGTVTITDAQVDQLAQKLKIDPATIVEALQSLVPTAEQNGAAARAAIVK